MRPIIPRVVLSLAVLSAGGCAARSPQEAGTAPAPAPEHGTATATAATPPAHSEADAEFMTGMIHHHAQAVLISGWAASHGASAALQRLTDRIVVGQQDEIAIMQRWLRERGRPVPAVDTAHAKHPMAHPMPGMLTPEKLDSLDRARGTEFDRLFLTYMIEHHQGALAMVDRLFGSQGAAQDDTVFRIAADVAAEQKAEIARMQQMLDRLPPPGWGS